jgi:aminopeptidase N
MKQVFATLFILQLSIIHCFAQPLKPLQKFTHADTLRGTYGPSRDWWDVQRYDLNVKFNFEDSTISGSNNITFKILNDGGIMQIDLQDPMILDSISYTSYTNRGKILITTKDFLKDGNAYSFMLNKSFLGNSNRSNIIITYFHGKPTIAKRPPWDGGLIWKRSADGSPFVSVACQGLGASVWYPCKDHQSDEPDNGASITFSFPDSLSGVANGRKIKEEKANGIKTVTWEVKNPINIYNLVPYIGKYAHFNEVYKGLNGNLDMDYWVLEENLEKAKKQFADAPRMMKAFEYWFGPYPFYKDGYKLVEAPHLGMEHQSATAYGNKYQNGYLGKDLSGSKNKWGLKWDFIIVHESGHEWFANNISSKDIADMWIHESFTNYSETLFLDYWFGKAAGNEYCIGTRRNIQNDIPIIGPYNVNQEGSGDMYYKGGNMIHTIRNAINDDEKFRQILRGLNKDFGLQTVTTEQVEKYINKKSKIDFSKVFDQYLRTTQIPVLEYKLNGYELQYRYTNCVAGFNLPLKINFKGERWIKPTTEWNKLLLYPEGENTFSVDENFYIKTKKVE